jgi:hypothetical protein
VENQLNSGVTAAKMSIGRLSRNVLMPVDDITKVMPSSQDCARRVS